MDHKNRGETPGTQRWTRWTYWPLTVAALVYLIVYTAHVVGDEHGEWALVAQIIIFTIWAMFVLDYLVQLALSSPRRRWARTHLYELAATLLPVLRPVRLLGAFTRIASFTKTAGSSIRARLLIYGLGSAILLIWYCALLVLQYERGAPGATILNFGDAVWWAFCTVTTVGYGDYTPVTVHGRVVAVFLMAGGVVLVGLIVASFGSWVTERAMRNREGELPATKDDLRQLGRDLGRPE